MKLSLSIFIIYSVFSGQGSARSHSAFWSTKKKTMKPKAMHSTKVNLKDFLPGASMDPHKLKNDQGITSANGPSLFDKVSRRYQQYESRLGLDVPVHRGSKDGITPADGISLFDKVSRRFMFYRKKLIVEGESPSHFSEPLTGGRDIEIAMMD